MPAPRVDRDVGAERLEFLDGFRRGGDARLAGVGFTRYGNSHSRLPARAVNSVSAAKAR